MKPPLKVKTLNLVNVGLSFWELASIYQHTDKSWTGTSHLCNLPLLVEFDVKARENVVVDRVLLAPKPVLQVLRHGEIQVQDANANANAI